MTGRLMFDLPTAVTQRALRFPPVQVDPRPGGGQLATWVEMQDDQATAAALASHETEREACGCEHDGHWVRWRGYPVLDPGPCPEGGVLDDVVEGCFCCFWGPGPVGAGESLHARLTREAFDDRDIQVEHRDRHGRWTRFEERF